MRSLAIALLNGQRERADALIRDIATAYLIQRVADEQSDTFNRVMEALKTAPNRKAAAKMAGVSRSTLYRQLEHASL